MNNFFHINISSNLNFENTLEITTQEGNVNIVAAIDRDSVYHEQTNQNLISSEIDIHSISTQTVVSSNLISSGNININSGNDINIIGSNLTGVDGMLNASGDINIISMAEINTYLDYHKEQSMDFTAVLVGAALAATGVGAAFGAIALVSSAALASSYIGVGSIATATLVGAGAGTQVQSGEIDKYTTITTNHISSNLNFTGDLTLTTEGDINLTASNITAEESITINLNGENSSLNLTSLENTITNIHEHEDIKPNYLTFGAMMFGYGFASGIIPPLVDKLDFALSINGVSAGISAGLGVGMIGGTNITLEDNSNTNSTIHTINQLVNLLYPLVEGEKPSISTITIPDIFTPCCDKPISVILPTTGTGANITVNISNPQIYGNINSGFSLINPDILDINKPLNPTIFHIHNKPTTTTTTTVVEVINPTINTNNLVINVNKP